MHVKASKLPPPLVDLTPHALALLLLYSRRHARSSDVYIHMHVSRSRNTMLQRYARVTTPKLLVAFEIPKLTRFSVTSNL